MGSIAGGRAAVLASAACFGTTGTVQALGVPGVPPASVGAARIAVGSAGLLAVAALTRSRSRAPAGPTAGSRSGTPGRAARAGLAGLVGLGALGVAGYQVCFFLAVHLAGVAVGTVVALGTAPVLTGLLCWAVGDGRPAARWWRATAVAAAGLTVLGAGDLAGPAAASVLPGAALAVGASASYAGYTIAAKRLLTGGIRPEACMAAIFTGGALLLSPVLVLMPPAWLATGRGAVEVLVLGLVATTLAYVLFARGLRLLPAAEAATLTLAEPLVATASGVLLLGERPGPAAAAGSLLLLAGLAVLTVRLPLRPAAEPA